MPRGIGDWNRGRLGICQDGKSKRFTFQICPKVREALNDFCELTAGDKLKSAVINQAILEYIERNK